MSGRCKVAIFMGVTNPEADTYHRQSMVLVPMDAPGVTVVRDLGVFGYHHRGGHAEVDFDNVRIPAANLLGEEGSGFAIAQARLGPGRIHHCMRLIGMAERAFDLMCVRSIGRFAFGRRPLDLQVGVARVENTYQIANGDAIALFDAQFEETPPDVGGDLNLGSLHVT